MAKGRGNAQRVFLEGRRVGRGARYLNPVTASRQIMLTVLEFYDVRSANEVMTSPQVVSECTHAGT